MGVGKSTVARQLAARLSYATVDTDQLIEQRAGADIPWIFDVEGESGFRQRESNILGSIQSLRNHVIATGGGIVVTPVNLPLLRSLGQVIYLTASVDQLHGRTSKDRKRPLLQVANPRARIEEIMRDRDPLYREVADHVVNTDGRSSKWVAQHIVHLLKEKASSSH